MYPLQYIDYTIKEKKHELLSKIRIVDDLLPDMESISIRKKYDFDNLISNYNDGKIGDDGRLVGEFSTKLVFYSEMALANINYGKLKKIHSHVFLVSDNQSDFKKSMHLDDTKNDPYGYTLSYHMMGDENCGGTSFYEDFHSDTPLLQIPFKENRLVIFPACIPHTGYTNHGYPNNSKRVIYTLFTILANKGSVI